MDHRIDRNPALAVFIASCIGVAISFWPVAFIASIAVPACALRQRKRIHAVGVTFACYACAIWPVIPGAKTFFGPKPGLLDSLAIWLSGAALLTIPYALLWAASRRNVVFRSILAVLISVPPPLGIIGVANPITAAGFLFPGTAWFGLAGTLAAIAALCIRPASAAITIAAVALTSNVVYTGDPRPPADWEAVNTNFGGLGLNGTKPDAEFQTAEFIQQRALASNARVIVLPETAVPRWTEATDLFWQPTLDALASNGKTILIGTTFDIPSQGGYRNGVAIRGTQNDTFLQHIPVPIGMWNPLRPSSVPLRLFGPSLITIAQHRVAILICYEQLLAWPIMCAVAEQPCLLVGISNDYWAARTRIPRLQQTILSSWGRLFALPVVFARNI